MIKLGRKSRLSNPPSFLYNLVHRDCLVENCSMKKQYQNKNSNPNRKNEGYHNPNNINNDDGVTIERNQNPNSSANDAHESMFNIREPINKKKQEIQTQLHKWTKHFKEMGKQDSVKVQNAIRLNLNILTPDNFAKLKLTFVELVKNNEENLKILVDKIIEKAWNEPKYIVTYANLCSFLQEEKTFLGPPEKSSEDNKKGKSKNMFKRFLLGRIQTAFEKQEFLKGKGSSFI